MRHQCFFTSILIFVGGAGKRPPRELSEVRVSEYYRSRGPTAPDVPPRPVWNFN